MPNAERGTPAWRGLWWRIGGLLLLTSLGVLLCFGLAYTLYWDQVLRAAPPEIRAFVEAVRPGGPGSLGSRGGPLAGVTLRPVLLALLLGLPFVLLVAALVARALLRPLASLERTAARLAGGELAVRAQPGGPFARFTADLNALAERLARAEAARQLASAAIAHELRTPLTALRLRLDGLQGGVIPTDPASYERLHAQLDVLERLADDLRTLTLAEAGELRLDRHDLDLSALAAAVVAELTPLAVRQGIDLDLTGQAAWMPGDAGRLRQALYNLIDNALSYTPPGGTVRVEVSAGPGTVTMRVMDSGPGVAEAELGRLFTPFYSADPTRSRPGSGSGLGLALVRAVTLAHGGQARAGSGPLGGLLIELHFERHVPVPRIDTTSRQV